MKIETEFNIEDTVYVMMFNDIYKTEVVKIEVHVDEDNASTKYWLSAGDMWHKDKDLFRTKESLIANWLEKHTGDD